ncbi:YkgJ family cysteine cluster protein [Pelagicoccus sp. SDUM812002]|uniref:YkgJ family cysteine cluster protein n=1 Tax=Pelagicoccus sp. SDUM812002 TaxID=3041266 RepID=UPI00280FA91A|nr:YkgJ family cysteine cluster protein [Pelagicoccus sp. SDUM812002]MDQ8185375.1 YkgJ family cysteine cluster protein [Pelagicoccus sp. SDUM812002]
MNAAEKLCLSCGMCCDGSLFDNVRLGGDEDPEYFKTLGLPVKRSRAKLPIAFVRQPCPALCGDCTCRIYEDRPHQCRSFECGVFKDASSGKITYESAHRSVVTGRRKAEKVKQLLRMLGETEDTLSVGARFRRVQRQVSAGGLDADAGEHFAALGLAMHKLDLFAHQKFYTAEVE